MNFRRTAARHPGINWALGAVEFVIIDAMMILGITPALAAAVSIPVAGYTFNINLGDVPSWIVAGVAAGGFWKAWRAEQKVSELGVKIDGMLVDRDAAKVAEGKAEEKIAAGVSADQLQKGVALGRAQERESVAAANPAPTAPAAVAAGEAPVPVADDLVGASSERVAKATEALAGATQDIADTAKKT